MANNKLTWQELRNAVVERANCTEQEAESFLAALSESVVEGLKSDKQVKIKGLGSFGLKAVAARKSVNIATGEDIVIEGYNKLTFNAESALKESVEKRIEKPATTEMVNELKNDPIKKLGEQAGEIVDILAELGQAPAEKVKGEKVKGEKVKSEKVKGEKAKGEKAKGEKVKGEKVKGEKAKGEEAKGEKDLCKCKCKCKYWWCWLIGLVVVVSGVVASVYYSEQIIGWWQCTKIMDGRITVGEYHDMVTRTKHIKTEEPIKERKSLSDHWNTVCNEIESWEIGATITTWWENIKFWEKEEVEVQPEVPSMPVTSGREVTPLAPRALTPNPPTTTVASPSVMENSLVYDRMPGIQTYYAEEEDVVSELENASVELLEDTIEEVAEEVAAELTEEVVEEVVEEEVVAALADLPRVYTRYIATEIVDKNSRLTLIAQKYYGNKDLWVFIYEANRQLITNPAQISEGQKLLIPELDAKYLDLSNPELRKLVDALTAEYVK